MKGRLSGTSSLMVIGLLLAPAASAAEAEIGAVIQEVYSGATGVRLTGQQDELRFQHPVHADEKVVTTADAATQLQFLDESTLYVGANSVVVLDKFVYDPASQLGSAAIRLTKGAFRFVSGEMKNEEAISLRTPKATLVIRGTTVSAFVFDDGSEVIDVDGKVLPIACPGGGNEKPVDLASGQSVLIDYMCNTTVGNASVSESGPPEFYSFTPAGAGGSSAHENVQRGAQAGEQGVEHPPISSSSPSFNTPPSDSDSDDGTGDGDDGTGDGESGGSF